MTIAIPTNCETYVKRDCKCWILLHVHILLLWKYCVASRNTNKSAIVVNLAMCFYKQEWQTEGIQKRCASTQACYLIESKWKNFKYFYLVRFNRVINTPWLLLFMTVTMTVCHNMATYCETLYCLIWLPLWHSGSSTNLQVPTLMNAAWILLL